MMQIQADSVGCAVPRHSFTAVIHSLFNSAVNFKIPGRQTLITLLVSETSDLPQGIRIRERTGFSTQQLFPGQRIFCDLGILHLARNSLSIDLNNARIWHGDGGALRFDPKSSAQEEAWKTADQALRMKKQLSKSSQLPAERIEDRLAAGLDRLTRASQKFDLFQAQQAAGELIGLGPGLTPSGDDILVGFMAGLSAACAQDPAGRGFMDQFGRILTTLSAQTNEISRTYLFHAAQGKFSSHILALLQAVCLGSDKETVLRTADLIFQAGHTSGTDTAAGLLAGLTTCAGDLRFQAEKMKLIGGE